MEQFDLSKALDELFKPTDQPTEATLTTTTEVPAEASLTNEPVLTKTTEAPTEATLSNTTEAPNPISFESILSRLSPEGQAWLNGLNHDLEKDEAFSAAVNGLPKIVELITAAPEEKRSLALAAAHQTYLRTAQELGYDESDAQQWASAVMSLIVTNDKMILGRVAADLLSRP
jgi:hypothetical protein